MDNAQKFSEILKKYCVFSIEKIEENNVIFKYQGKIYFTLILLYDNYDFNEVIPLIVVNDFYEDYPHIMMESIKVKDKEYRSVCLYEKEKYIFSDLSYTKKIEFLLERLERLLNLSGIDQEKEFQKEFSHYWNASVSIKFTPHIYFTNDSELSCVNYYLKNGKYRVLTKDKKLNDMEGWKKTKDKGFLIPIVNKNNILPPTKSTKWTVQNLLNILQNPQINKISSSVYNKLKKTVIRSKKIDLYFSLPFENSRNLIFGCRVKYKNSGSKLFFDKLIDDVVEIEPFFLLREDFDYLNQSIGNVVLEKKVAIIGCGSLGSYVASELIKSGVRDLVLVDEDIFSNENTFRHILPHRMKIINKALALKYTLEGIHPEIAVESITKKFEEKDVNTIVSDKNVDILIFCIGSTDEQRKLSKALIASGVECAILYSWLESNGEDSRTIGIPKNSSGCFSCTKKEVESIFPSRTESDEEFWISDGCGGTRVKYGNRTLLAATNGLLEAFDKIIFEDSPFVISSNIINGIIKKSLIIRECDICGEKIKKV
ncbi:ThiF family adenylyltransferase [Enterococcus hirae]|uniref:ThiF family adenylyltransferase n=1 Tax=Enterococcus hirae TaxID=1354 RepID=UPI0038488875